MTTPLSPQSQATHIAQLRHRVERYPVLHEEVKRLDDLRQTEVIVSAIRDQIQRARVQRASTIYVFGDTDVSASGRSLQNAESKAASLAQTIGGWPRLGENELRRLVGELRRAAEAAVNAVKAEWSREVEYVIQKYERLANALSNVGLADGTSIRGAIARVRRLTEPPTTDHAARQAAEDFHSLAPAVGRLGASGVVGDFMVAALEGNGQATSLRDPVVIRFLDENGLWDMLRVRING